MLAIDALTYADARGALWAVVVFALPLFCPGYCAGWVANVVGFRGLGWAERMAWSVALSFCLTPVLVVYLAKYGSMRWAMAGLWMAVVGAAGLILWEWWARRAMRSAGRGGHVSTIGGLAAGWTLFVVLELIDLCRHGRMWMSVTVYDHALRTAFVDAAARTGVPPVNPLFWPGGPVAMRYYYFWYVVTGLVERVGQVTARQAMMASCVWAGFGLAAVIALFWRRFGGGARRRWMLWMALIAVTGMDLLPALAQPLAGTRLDPDMEWWSSGQVTSWVDTLLWVPHHAAALVCCVTGFLLAWLAREPRVWAWSIVLAGVGFASAFGLSVYVAAAFAMVAVLWGVWVLGGERGSRGRLWVMAGAGVVAVILLAPYLRELHKGTSGAAGGERVLGFGVRALINPATVEDMPGLRQMRLRHPVAEDAAARLLLMAPGYVAELGFYGAVLLLAIRRWRLLDEAGRTAVVLAVAGLVVCSFVRSTVIDTNDFGVRGVLIAQFFLLVLAGRWMETSRAIAGRLERWSVMGLLVLGVMSTVYQAGMLRVYLPWREHRGDAEVVGLAEQSFALKRAYAAMDRVLAQDAVVQFNHRPALKYVEFAQLMTVGRQVAASTSRDCGAVFGGNAAACAVVSGRVTHLFAASGVDRAAAVADCRSLGVDYLIVTAWDGPWQEKNGWAWTLPVMTATEKVRVLACKAGPFK